MASIREEVHLGRTAGLLESGAISVRDLADRLECVPQGDQEAPSCEGTASGFPAASRAASWSATGCHRGSREPAEMLRPHSRPPNGLGGSTLQRLDPSPDLLFPRFVTMVVGGLVEALRERTRKRRAVGLVEVERLLEQLFGQRAHGTTISERAQSAGPGLGSDRRSRTTGPNAMPAAIASEALCGEAPTRPRYSCGGAHSMNRGATRSGIATAASNCISKRRSSWGRW